MDLLSIINKDLWKGNLDTEEYNVKEILKDFSKELLEILANFRGEPEDLEKIFIEYIKKEFGIKLN